MKKFYLSTLLLFSILFAHVPAFSQWYQLNSGTTNHLNSVFFTDENTGYAVGENGTILKTTNGGDTWILQNTSTNNDLNSVFFINEDIGYAVGHYSTFLKTIDGGANWNNDSNLFFTNFHNLKCIFFISENTGRILTHDMSGTMIYSTFNSGQTWIPYFDPEAQSNGWWEGNFMVEDTIAGRIVIAGEKGMVKTVSSNLGSSDYLEMWGGSLDINSELNSVCIRDKNTSRWHTVGQNGIIGFFSNYGNGNQISNVSANLNSIVYIDSLTGYVAGDDGVILNTINEGGIWSPQLSGTLNNLNCIYFVNQNIGFVVGDNGTIIKTVNGGVGLIDYIVVSDNISIFVDHSNQFVEISIENDLSKSFYELYNVEGKLISKGEITQNKQNVSIENLSVGLYFIKIHNNDIFKTMKFISL